MYTYKSFFVMVYGNGDMLKELYDEFGDYFIATDNRDWRLKGKRSYYLRTRHHVTSTMFPLDVRRRISELEDKFGCKIEKRVVY